MDRVMISEWDEEQQCQVDRPATLEEIISLEAMRAEEQGDAQADEPSEEQCPL